MSMIDISDKNVIKRTAKAYGEIILSSESIKHIKEKKVKKGDVLEIAKITGIQAAKNCWNTIPLCHQIPLEKINIEFNIEPHKITGECTVIAHYKTGVEIEAILGISTALITIWDMIKYIEKDEYGQYPTAKIENIIVKEKKKWE